jgi:hypothetical protein
MLFDAFAAARSPYHACRRERLAKLLDDVRPLLGPVPLKKSSPPTIAINAERTGAVFETLTGPLAKAAGGGQMSNVWAIAGLKRNEVRNAAALASLWSPGLFPNTAAPFLRAFWRRLPSLGVLPTGLRLGTEYTVRTEECPLGNAANRVDLSVEGRDFLLLIEVKIDAPEGEQQVARYNEVLQAKAQLLGKRPLLVLLGPHPPTSGLAVHASWSDVSAAALAIARQRKAAERTFADQLLHHFAAHVAAFD